VIEDELSENVEVCNDISATFPLGERGASHFWVNFLTFESPNNYKLEIPLIIPYAIITLDTSTVRINK